ncbi:MAG: 1-acyl-sn-glycerol-3-phosphate acyltransferase [Planctomyces sp.]|nr:1-acyl-sn-glycerol-3-phosphate acyltransferase [Planctomyces sp.]
MPALPAPPTLRARDPGRSVAQILWYALCRGACHAAVTLVYRLRVWGRGNVPPTGPLLVVSNHQSFLDPLCVGSAVGPRHLHYVAKSGLFKGRATGALIRSVNAHPIRQDAPDTAAIRKALETLALGRALLVFPEGSRTLDGRMQPFKRGAWVLMSRARCPVLPVAVEGTYDAYRRGWKLPRVLGGPGVGVMIGRPIPADELLALGPEAGLERLAGAIDRMRCALHQRLGRAGTPLSTPPAPRPPEPAC